MLVLTRKCGESVRVGDNVEITLLNTRRDKARIGITAPGQVILRADAVDRDASPRDASPRKVSVMRMDRTMCEVDAKFMADYAEVLMFARAKDGVYVPSCDLAHYEAGKRGVA
jgi:carbon storage regulator